MSNENVGKEVTVTQWPMGDWGSVSGRDLMMTQLRRQRLLWHPALVSSTFRNWSNFGEKPSCNWMSLVKLSVM